MASTTWPASPSARSSAGAHTVAGASSRARVGPKCGLQVDRGHPGLVIAIPRRLRQLSLDPRQVIVAELHVDRRRVLLQVLAALRAGNRDQILALSQHPGQGQLCGSDALL